MQTTVYLVDLEKRLMRLLNLEMKHHVIKWFNDDQFQENASKFHVLLRTDQQVHVNIDTAQIKNIQYEELLGVTIDTKLSVKT